VCTWTGIVAGSLAFNLAHHAKEVESLTTQTARALILKDLSYREWSILHGGVYVPVSSQPETRSFSTNDDGRDIVTPSGQQLTLLNPAILSRQIFALQEEKLRIVGHITSLKPIRPGNLPDAWERRALEQFNSGVEEASTVEVRDGENYFRMMRPLRIVKSCLRCHEEGGHQEGEIRGGISVAVPMNQFVTPGANSWLTIGHLALWFAGLVGLFFGARDLRSHEQARVQAEQEQERLIAELHKALASVKTLTGLIPICSSCKKIRDDHGYWTRLETYLEQHSQAEFSHGLCLDCMRKLYPEVAQAVEERLPHDNPNPPPAQNREG